MTIEHLLKDGITAVLFMLYAIAVGTCYVVLSASRRSDKVAFLLSRP